ncbi:MAG TPA: phenylalanine--tRNA ligase subunit beta [Lactobacillus sp.]|nr:phenylalanine--tRNA ligase subunit beta [Lactobacillus sp.]
MKVSMDWLNEYLTLNVDPQVLGEKIERTAVEVDQVYKMSDGMSKLVVGETLSVEPHPDSDHLHICQVDVGEEAPLQIVCGAPNVAVGQKVIVALPGAWIAGHNKIKKSKMRGVASNGMLCALQEIGFDEKIAPKAYEEGIYILPEDSQNGTSVFPILGMDDAIVETDLTPNRGDMNSMNGTAWEVGAIYGQTPKMPTYTLKEDGKRHVNDLLQFSVDETLAPTYKMRVVSGVTIQDSPLWLQKRLWEAGMRPINNIVDVTNYIMLTYGQPLHAFDYDKLASKHIHVRLADEGEHLTTLDGEDRALRDTDMVIADDQHAIALAGTMGGLDTEIDDNTTTIAIESAIFDPIKIRKTARFFNLHSEASMRFERGINKDDNQNALDHAAALMAELGNGQTEQGTGVGADTPVEPAKVGVTLTRINHVLGTQLTVDQVQTIFDHLNFPTVNDGETFNVTVPVRRWDIHIEADLFEEVARLYGYDNIPSTLPYGIMTPGALTLKQRVIRDSRQLLEGAGLNQAISYALTTTAKAKQFMMRDSEPTELAFPMSTDHTTTRMNLISGLLDDIAYNVARKQKNVALYEQGRVFYREGDEIRPLEVEHIAGAVTGARINKTWHTEAATIDFYGIKGIVDLFLHDMGLSDPVRYQATQAHAQMHPGRTADIYVGDQFVGFVGQVHPAVEAEYKIPETYVFELNLQALIDAKHDQQQYEPISKFPDVTRDIAILVDRNVTNAQVVATINKRGGAHLADVQLFDVYEGAHLPSGKKSLAYTLTYRDRQATLVEADVTAAFNKVTAALEKEFSAEIR